MKTLFLTALFCVSAFTGLTAAPSADQVLAGAKSQAAVQHKAVFVHFGASWCKWCKLMDAWLQRPEVKAAFEKYFVPVELVIRENAENKAREHAGAGEFLKRWGGENAGIPFSVFLDREGKLIVSSMRPSGEGQSQNIGYPAKREEVDWFVAMMKKAAPHIAQDDLKALEASLQTPAK